MIRHIIAGIGGILFLVAFYYMYSNDTAHDKLGKIAAILEKSEMMATMAQQQISQEEMMQGGAEVIGSAVTAMADQTDENEETLKALRDKAGSMASFKVSRAYKTRCASCHGIGGEGGVGPVLIGKDEAFLIQSLRDYKSGKEQNYVMYGLLAGMQDEELVELAREIATFEAKRKQALEP